jgi:hypothetical protein
MSTLLGGLRSRATWGNAGLHSGEGKIHGKDRVAGSIPAGGSSANGSRLRPGATVFQQFSSNLERDRVMATRSRLKLPASLMSA